MIPVLDIGFIVGAVQGTYCLGDVVARVRYR